MSDNGSFFKPESFLYDWLLDYYGLSKDNCLYVCARLCEFYYTKISEELYLYLIILSISGDTCPEITVCYMFYVDEL